MSKFFTEDSNDQAAGTFKGCESKCQPDSCLSWVVCAASTMSIAITAAISYSFGLLLPPLTESFEETRQAIGKMTYKTSLFFLFKDVEFVVELKLVFLAASRAVLDEVFFLSKEHCYFLRSGVFYLVRTE